MPGVGGAMCAVLLAVRRCIKGDGSDFWMGNMTTGGEPGDEGAEEEDMGLTRPDLLLLGKAGVKGAISPNTRFI